MVLKSFAKINLTLSVIKKMANGFHDIQSLFCLVDLSDKIYIKKIYNQKIDEISFKGPFSKMVKKNENSIKKILRIMRQKNMIFNYYSIKVIKNIPVFSGFGGGTSNAATILKYLMNKKIEKKIIEEFTNKIGSDLRLFFYKQGFLRNLKTIVKLRKKYKLYFLLAFPRIKSSTKEVYLKTKQRSKKRVFLQKSKKDKKNLLNFISSVGNDLQLNVEKNNPIIRELLINICKESGCYLSQMTGSGSACFGLFINERCSKAALISLRNKYPKFWFSIAKTI